MIAPRALAIAAVLALRAVAPMAQTPGVIPVTTTTPGAAVDGQCSLVEAIDNANAAGAVHADCQPGAATTTIELAASATYTLTAPHNSTDDGVGLPVVTGHIAVNGNGATIERSTAPATPAFRLFFVAANASLALNSITLRNGSANPDSSGAGGGAVSNSGTLTISGSTISGNASGTSGGGIASNGAVTIAQTVIASNTAVLAGGGVASRGGSVAIEGGSVTLNASTGQQDLSRGGGIANHAIDANATMTIAGTVVSGNTSEGVGGGGIDNAAATNRTALLEISDAAISDNAAHGIEHFTGLGGGIQNSFFRGIDNASATTRLVRTTVSGNSAVNGGGVSNGFDLPRTLTLVLDVQSSTISGNSVAGSGFVVGNGGGIFAVNGTTTVVNSTISGNAATGTGQSSGLGGGIMNAGLSGAAGTLEISGSTIADNDAATSGGGVANVPFNGIATAGFTNTLFARNDAPTNDACANAMGTLVSHGHNLEDGNTCQLTQAGDLPNTSVSLGALQNNGGPTRTHALLPLSAGIDAGDDAACAAAGGVDQRGVTRPQGAACDIGSYESQWAAASSRLGASFALDDNTRGTRSFVLLTDGRFVDDKGSGGTWGPFSGGLALLYDAGVECSAAWIGSFSSPTELAGRIACRDGSNIRGVWKGTLSQP